VAKRPGLHDAFIRVPEETWERFTRAAEREHRSATQQIVWLIEQYLQGLPDTEGETGKAPRPAGPAPAPERRGSRKAGGK
jgi:hypothetical protein